MVINKVSLIDYILVILIIFISGNITFTNDLFLIFTLILSIIVFNYRKKSFDKNLLVFLLILSIILLLQSFKFQFFPIITYIGVYIRILIAYFILKGIGNSFLEKYINIMFFLSIISLFFYSLIFLFPILGDFLINSFTTGSVINIDSISRYSVLGLYTIIPKMLHANAGPFWEMGAFGGYLILAILFNLFTSSSLVNKKNIIILITILTTQSTTAYLSLFILIFIISFKNIKNLILKIFISGSIILSFYFAYTNLDFLEEKITYQIHKATLVKNYSLENADSQRFINIIKDWRDFQNHELLGRGPNSETRYTSLYKEKEIRTVGSTDMIVRYGLPFFIFILYLMYTSISSLSKHYNKYKYPMSFVFLILLLLMSETYFLHPLFWILIMFQFIYTKSSINYIKDN